MQRQGLIDLIRIIAIFGVIVIHHGLPALPESYSVVSKLSFRWAVPFFFIISGYFIGRKRNVAETAMHAVVKLCVIFLIWSLMYMPFNIYMYGVNGGMFKIFNYGFFVHGGFGHLWFLSSMVLGYIFLVFVDYNVFPRFVYWLIAFVCFGVVIGSDSYNILKISFDTDYTRHFVSLPFMLYGYHIAKKGVLKNSVALFLTITSLVVAIVEIWFLWYFTKYEPSSHQFTIGIVLFSCCFTNYLLGSKGFVIPEIVQKIGMNFTIFVYVFHNLLQQCTVHFLQPLYEYPIANIMFPLLNFVLSFAIAILLYKYAPTLYALLTASNLKVKKSEVRV
ncbi:MAG: acyltransferase [Fibrobacterales bacterium]